MLIVARSMVASPLAPRPRFFVSQVCDPAAPSDPRRAFRVAWRINPHMEIGSTCLARACAQHTALLDALRDAGAEVELYPFVRDCFDCVFAKDNAVLVADGRGCRALVCRPRHAVRAREQVSRTAVLRAKGMEIAHARTFLEGGDVVRVGGSFLLGHGFRSERAAADELADFTGTEVLALELVDPRLYHLDTALCALGDGTILVSKEAFTRASLAALARWDHVERIIEIPRGDALRFGLNLIEVGERVILASGASRVERALRERGRTPIAVPLDQFHRAGGSAACLVSELHPLAFADERAA
jgi:N-dimethylarginine dimethylaminohydrolase